MAEFRVTWEIDIWADTAEEAAKQARVIQQMPTSTATVFDVRRRRDETGSGRPFGRKQTFDLNPEA